MKDRTYTKSLTYAGAGAGVVLFAIFGLLPGLFLGGVMGLNLAVSIFGTPAEAGVMPAILVVSMALGAMVAGIIFITAASILGWLVGTAVDGLSAKSSSLAEAKNRV